MKSLLPCLLLPVLSLAAGEADPTSIWKVSDADSTVFLAGSVHLLRKKDLPLPPHFDRVYAESEEIVFEIDMAAMGTPESAAEMKRLGSLPEGDSLEKHFSPALMERLRGYARDRGVPSHFFDRYTPGMTYLLLSSLEAMRLGASPELGLESTYHARSTADGKPSRGLETLAFQVSCLNGFSAAEIEKWLTSALDSFDESVDFLDRITEAWRRGEDDKLAAILREEPGFTPELHRVLLVERNRNWIPEIEKALAEKHDVMFLVGAAHLVGEDGVVDLLRDRGFEVVQLEKVP